MNHGEFFKEKEREMNNDSRMKVSNEANKDANIIIYVHFCYHKQQSENIILKKNNAN